MRGRSVLLLVFATYDPNSQLALNALTQFADTHPKQLIVAIAVQPMPERILPAFEHALNPTFLLAYDPSESILAGTSGLGEVKVVPYYVLLDAEGRIADRRYGAMSPEALDHLVSE
ncbi:MAG: hypothetical protein H6714_10310 [Myxococcales bacterium]|nr:hypothetical protein [Myxococcales bacterium]